MADNERHWTQILKLSGCPCTSIYCRSRILSSLLFIHVQLPTHSKLWSPICFLSLAFKTGQCCSFICFLPLNNYSIHLQVVNHSYQSQGDGVKRTWKRSERAKAVCRFQLLLSSWSLTTGSIDFKERGTGETELVLADVIKNLPSKDNR